MERRESKKYTQRLDSTKVYVDGLQERYSKINCVRVDLGYAKEFSGTVTIEDVNKDFQKMLNNCQVQSKNVPKCSRKMYHFVTPIC